MGRKWAEALFIVKEQGSDEVRRRQAEALFIVNAIK